MKKIIAMLLCLSMLAAFAACSDGDKQKEPSTPSDSAQNNASTEPSQGTASAYASALEVMQTIWENMPEDTKFSCFGGNQTENATMDEPGQFSVSDTKGMSYMLLIPEELHGSVDDAASLVHLMNANTFTSAALHIKGAELSDVAAKLEAAILGNQFLCGFPDKLVLISAGDYLIYAFGAEDLISSFQSAALEHVSGAALVKEAAF